MAKTYGSHGLAARTLLSFVRLICDAAVWSREEHERLIMDAFDHGILWPTERDDTILTDIVIHGQDRDTDSVVLLVIAVAPAIGAADVEQAFHRTTLWAKLGGPAQPIVAGLTTSSEGARLVHDQRVLPSLLPDLIGPDALGHSVPTRTTQTQWE
jgi:hypothetical protein